MRVEPVVVNEDDVAWETWPAEKLAERGNSSWRTVISAGRTPSNALTFGVARLPPGGVLQAHRHAQAEVYFVLGGSGVVTVDGDRHVVGVGDAVFLPGGAMHSVVSTGGIDLRVAYILAADSFDDVVYVFGD
jgi:mannose-6-phosphate isomerase-like protein (cupin superfamily)